MSASRVPVAVGVDAGVVVDPGCPLGVAGEFVETQVVVERGRVVGVEERLERIRLGMEVLAAEPGERDRQFLPRIDVEGAEREQVAAVVAAGDFGRLVGRGIQTALLGPIVAV